ncbi:AraC family transcriptional regulator [Streptomyces albiflavescens]|uniref:AraC family transcriptional regulator n=1 Tax=Streptomyces albiflavescens TaxID=1623582 RepID=A0A917XSM6_9ACTN|nr:helix-turn-helix domain-containing protein [Streptomyces albiflavescens]GGN50423.1 AraC family transcriptional regulator [Streptomyces albiflavescens]
MSTVERLIVIVLFEGVDLLDVTRPPEVFSLVRRETHDATGYHVVLAAETLDPVTTSAGVRVLPDITFYEASTRSIDTLLVPGSVEVDGHRRVHALTDPAVVGRVKTLADRTRRVTSVCVGAHILAAAGLLDGKRATTHWSTAQQLAAEHPLVEDLRHYVMRNLGGKLSVADLAGHAHVSERQLTRIFRTELGTTPSSYIESARVEMARNQLESTEATLERIASTCGFGTPDTLIRAFRRKLNTTPTEYRRRFRAGPSCG